MPKVSVLMPVYNTKEEFLREAVASILNQTFQDFEFLIIDNGSDPYVKSIIKSYNDNRIQYFRLEQNQGPAAARNYAIKHASGDYLAFMDSDDVSLPQRLQMQADFLTQNPHIGCLGTTVKTIGKKAECITFIPIFQHHDIEFSLAFSGCTFCQSSIMLRKKVLNSHNICYEPALVPAEDYGLYVSLLSKTQFATLKETLVYYRFYGENTSNKQSTAQTQKSNEIRCLAIEKYCAPLALDAPLFIKFFQNRPLSKDELTKLAQNLDSLINKAQTLGCTPSHIRTTLKKFVKKSYYHTRSLQGQWNLIKSPIGKMFGFSFGSRLICLITRGLF